MCVLCQDQWWELDIHYKIMSFTSLKFSRGFSLHLRQNTSPILDIKALHGLIPSATPLPLAQYLPAATTLFLLLKHDKAESYPRTFTLAALPARAASLHFLIAGFPRTFRFSSRKTIPNLKAASPSPSIIWLYLIFCRTLISVWNVIFAFIWWPTNSTGTEALFWQRFVCLAYLLSLWHLEHFLREHLGGSVS